MPRGHTYDKWQELGYQVKRGEKHSFNYFGNKCFTRDQVVRINDELHGCHETEEESEYEYEERIQSSYEDPPMSWDPAPR